MVVSLQAAHPALTGYQAPCRHGRLKPGYAVPSRRGQVEWGWAEERPRLGGDAMPADFACADNPMRVPLVIVAVPSPRLRLRDCRADGRRSAATRDDARLYHGQRSACLMVGDELLPPASGPGPVSVDKRYPYIDNARQADRHPTDLSGRRPEQSNPPALCWCLSRASASPDPAQAGKQSWRGWPRQAWR
jgi:hypothetical protein